MGLQGEIRHNSIKISRTGPIMPVPPQSTTEQPGANLEGVLITNIKGNKPNIKGVAIPSAKAKAIVKLSSMVCYSALYRILQNNIHYLRCHCYPGTIAAQ